MTSIFDQYEQASQSFPLPKTPTDAMRDNLGYIEEDVPMFLIQKYKNTPIITSRITHLCASNGIVALYQSNGILHCVSENPEFKPKELDISKNGAKLRNMFMDPVIGSHLLLSLTYQHRQSPVIPELFYLSVSSMKLKAVTKMHGHEVTAVAWNLHAADQQFTGPVLLGTSKGLIFEIEIEAEPDKLFQSGIERYCKQVFDVGKGRESVTGLGFNRFVNAPEKYFVVATTPTRLYQFVGTTTNPDERPLLSQIFNTYLNIPEGFIEIRNSINSSLRFCYDFCKVNDTAVVFPKSFGWYVEGAGVVYGTIDENFEMTSGSLCAQDSIIAYDSTQPPPVSMVLTKFHILLVYSNRVTAISVLNKENVFVEFLDEAYGKFVTAVKEVKEDIVWLCSERAVFVCKITREDRFVWKVYLDNEQYDLAKEYCRGNPLEMNEVLLKQAGQYFQEGRYQESAELYAGTQCCFEEIALRFLQAKKIDALKLFLQKKLETLRQNQSTQVTMLTLWLIEIYETQLGDIRNSLGTQCESYQNVQTNFEQFLAMPQVTTCVEANHEIVYKLLSSHGDDYNLIKIAHACRDYERLVKHFIRNEDFDQVFRVLSSPFVSKKLICSFVPELFHLAPMQTCDLLIREARNVDPLAVLKNLMFPYNDNTQAAEVIRYLEYCVHSLHRNEEELHNYLIALYVKHNPDRLMQYLAIQGQDASTVNYDIRNALKLCQENGLVTACVQLSALLGLWESAVDLALSVSTDLAKQTISSVPHGNVDLRKKLWLKIAKLVVDEYNDIKQAMEFLQQCDLIKIEDVLPFFSDFTTVDHFKDAICSSLQEYNKNIEMLKEEMEDATMSAEDIRGEIHAFKNRYTVIQSNDVCCSCQIQLLLRPFYAFPCNHYFHSDCLVNELKPFLSDSMYMKLQNLQKQLSTMSPTTDTLSAGSSSVSMRDQVKSEIDNIIASDCLFCGAVAIEQVDKGFINDEEFERIKKEWE